MNQVIDKYLAVKTEIAKWRRDPIYGVRKLFTAEPDPWQADALQLFADPTKQRLAFKACKGPGKTAFLAWCMWLFFITRPHPKIAATSISAENLRDNLWTELAHWQHKSPYLRAKARWQKTQVVSIDHPETWWMSARTWSKTADKNQQSLTLAGLHAKYTLAVLDESGGIPDGVMATADASLSTEGGEHRILQAGNPTHLEGPLYRAATTERHLWSLIEITGDPESPKRSPRISVQWAKEQIQKYGRENPWVLVNVFGQFPPGSLNALLGPDQVSEAMQRHYNEDTYAHAAKIIGVDVGRFGGDRTVIFPRQGKAAFTPIVLRPDRNTKGWTGIVAGRIAQGFDKWKADMIFVDDTGGWGAGVIDSLETGGYPVVAVPFSGKAMDPRYKNRRAEMHFLAANHVKGGGALPNIPELVREATATNYWYHNDQFQVEEKDQVKVKLGGDSPDLWDAFCLTFAAPIAAKTGLPHIDQAHAVRTEHEHFTWGSNVGSVLT